MNTALWIVQAILAVIFFAAGTMKLVRSKEQLATTMGWVEGFSQTAIRRIGAAEIVAALGLILPGVTGIATFLTPLAATGLVLLMAGAIRTHARRGETSMIVLNLILAAMALFVAIGRFGPSPL